MIKVLDNRKKLGVIDEVGREATPITAMGSKYERGKKILETLTGRAETGPKTGYAAFSPEIEIFLKEHLFADIFERDILNFIDREIVTISALATLGGVEPQLQGHLNIGMNIGLTETHLIQLLSIIETSVGKNEADSGHQVLNRVLKKPANTTATLVDNEKGNKAPAQNFIGNVWVKMLVQRTSTNNYTIGKVTFEPGARSNWHSHPAGQILLITEGQGLYQEKGSPVRTISRGETIICPPDIEHWHGASPTNQMVHIAVTNLKGDSAVTWLKPVTDEEYNAKL